MRDAINVYGRAFLDLWEEWLSMIVANLICFVCFIPGFFLLGMLTVAVGIYVPEGYPDLVAIAQFLSIPLAAVSILTGGPALAGVHNLTNPIPHEKRIEFSYFWEGFKLYYLKS